MFRVEYNLETGETKQVELTAEELQYISDKAAAETTKAVLDNIKKLEQEVTPRRLRDAILNPSGKTWLTSQEAKIQTERDKL
jgi:hypothetical protein